MRILPNRNSIGLVFVLLAMGYAGASQSNAAAFLLAYLTFSLALVSALHGWRNLRGLSLTVDPPPAVFAGEEFSVHFTLRSGSGHIVRALSVTSRSGGRACRVEAVIPGEPSRGELPLPAPVRGCFPELSLRVSSTFPLGFATARQDFTIAQPWCVYPKPAGDLPLPVDPRLAPASPAGAQPEGDDFAGVRDWRAGESMRHIDWKAAARSDRLMVKQWSGGMAGRFLFDWDALPGLETEARLSQLARWVVLAARMEAAWELRLPGHLPIPLGRGEHHFHASLRALAQH